MNSERRFPGEPQSEDIQLPMVYVDTKLAEAVMPFYFDVVYRTDEEDIYRPLMRKPDADGFYASYATWRTSRCPTTRQCGWNCTLTWRRNTWTRSRRTSGRTSMLDVLRAF